MLASQPRGPPALGLAARQRAAACQSLGETFLWPLVDVGPALVHPSGFLQSCSNENIYPSAVFPCDQISRFGGSLPKSCLAEGPGRGPASTKSWVVRGGCPQQLSAAIPILKPTVFERSSPLPLARQQCCRFFCGSRPMASVEELVAKANQLRRLRQEAGQKSRELKRQAMAIDAGQAVTPWGAKRVAMRVFALSGFNLAASTKYLRHKGRWSDDTGCRTWYHALPTESRAQLLHPAEGDGVARRQLAEARTFVEEEQLVAWIQLQNQAKGIAPTPGAVLDQGPVPPSWGGSLNSQRRRLRRLVARRGGRKAVFGGNEQLEPAVLERKARRSHSSCPCASP